jgi:hypothetical protein
MTEQKLLKILLVQLKLVALGCLALMLLFLFSAFKPGPSDDLWKRLGISREIGEDNISESFFRGYLFTAGVGNLKNIVTGDKAAVTYEILVACKKHVGGEAFRQEYNEYRKRVKPVAPAVRTKEEIRNELVLNYEEAVRNNQGLVNLALSMRNDDMKKSAEKSLAKCRTILDELQTGNSKLIVEQMIYADMRFKTEMNIYQTNICAWEQKFPADPRQLIKTRLESFMRLTKDIDFKATTKVMQGKKIFTDPYYERKPAAWKMGYRAGKEVTQTARTFAASWLQELSHQ